MGMTKNCAVLQEGITALEIIAVVQVGTTLWF